MAKRAKVKIDTGTVCEKCLYQAPGSGGTKSQPRFKTEAERAEHRRKVAWRDHTRKVNENFRGYELYSVLTFDDAHDVHTFEEARRVRDNYRRRLLRSCPDALIHIYYQQSKTNHWYLRLLSKGVPAEIIHAKWGQGLARTQTMPGAADRTAPVDFDKSGLTVTFNGRTARRSPEVW